MNFLLIHIKPLIKYWGVNPRNLEKNSPLVINPNQFFCGVFKLSAGRPLMKKVGIHLVLPKVIYLAMEDKKIELGERKTPLSITTSTCTLHHHLSI